MNKMIVIYGKKILTRRPKFQKRVCKFCIYKFKNIVDEKCKQIKFQYQVKEKGKRYIMSCLNFKKRDNK